MIVRGIALLLLPVLLYLVYIAGSWGLADVYARPVMNQLEEWRRGNVQLKDEDWHEFQQELTKALQLDPDNPDYHDYMALAIEGRYAFTPPNDTEAKPFRREAKHHYLKAIKLRPSWPYSRANFALVKYRLGEIDDEFYHALHKADELGPWEPGVQRVIVDVGLHYWKSLPRDERKFILNIIAKSLKHAQRQHSIRVLELTKRYAVLELVCLIHEDTDYVNQYCRKNLRK